MKIQPRQIALKRDIRNAQLTNTSTFGRQERKDPDATVSDSTRLSPRQVRPSLVTAGQSDQSPVDETEPSKEPKSKKEYETAFLNAFGEGMSDKEGAELARHTAASMEQLLRGGGSPDPASVLAAHSYNYAQTKLRESEDSSDVSRYRRVRNSAADYLRAVKRESAVQRAQMVADNQKTLIGVAQSMTTIASERMKSAAKIHQMNAETSRSISEIYQSIHMNQTKSAAKGNQKIVHLLTEVWPES